MLLHRHKKGFFDYLIFCLPREPKTVPRRIQQGRVPGFSPIPASEDLRGLEEQWENRTSTALETAFGSASLPPSSTWTTPPTPTYQEISTVIDEVLQLPAIDPFN